MRPAFFSHCPVPFSTAITRLFRPPVRTPTRLQFQTTECGVAVLGMMLAYFGRDVPLEEIRTVTGVSRDCLNAGDLVRGAAHFGLKCKALRKEPEDLPRLGFPLVAHLRFIHFTVVEAMDDKWVVLNDPATGRIRLERGRFDEDFTGIALTFTPDETFRPDEAPGRPSGLPGHRTGALPLALAAGLGLLTALLPAAAALVLTRPEPAAALALIAALRLALLLLQLEAWGAAAHRMTTAGVDRLLRFILGAPFAFHLYRLPASLAATVQAAEGLAGALCGHILPALIGAVAIPVSLAAAWWLSPACGWALTGLALAQVAVLGALAWKRAPFDRYLRRHDDELGAVATCIQGIERVKVAGEGPEVFAEVMGSKALVRRLRQRLALLDGLGRAVPVMFQAGALAVVLTAAGTGSLTPGQVLALLLLAWALSDGLAALAPLPGQIDAFRQTLSPVADVLAHPEEPAQEPAPATSGPFLQAENLSFGYAPLKPPILAGVNLSLERGEVLGITGPSGGGKSTLGSLLGGLVRPRSGSVTIGGRAVETLGPVERARAVAWVGREAFLFEGTIRENLLLWRKHIDDDRLAAAIRDACLEDVIADRPGGLEAKVEDDGRNFSGGQRQRLEIARALLGGPSILILDEATDGLDPALEAKVFENLRKRGLGLIVIAHRVSTLAECDRVVSLLGGQLTPATIEAGEEEAALQARSMLEIQAPPRPAIDTGPLVAAFRQVAGREIDIPARQPPWEAGVEALADFNGMGLRRVRFPVASWWAENDGPLLGFTRENREPVAVYPGDDPGRLEPWFYRIYPPFRPEHAWPWPLFRATLVPLGGELAKAAAQSFGSALLRVAPIAAAAVLFTGTAPPAWRVGLALGAAALALGLWETGRHLTLARLAGRQETGTMAALLMRIFRMKVSPLKSIPGDDVAQGLLGVGRLQELTQGGRLRQWLDLATVALALAVVLWAAPELVLAAPAAMGFAALLPLAFALAGRSMERSLVEGRVASNRFLYKMLGHLGRLRVLNVTEGAAGHIQADQRRFRALGRRLRRLESTQSALADCWPWLAAAPVLALVPETRAPAAFLGLWLGITAAREAGAAGAALIRSAPLFRQAERLSALPLETQGGALPAASEHIEVRGLAYHYPGTGRPALRDVGIEVRPGEIVAITGPSGGGKSTLLRLLLGFDDPDTGEIRIGGVPLDRLDVGAWRRDIGFVAQGAGMGAAQTLRSHIAGSSPYSLDEIWQALEAAVLGDDVRAMPMGIQNIVEENRISTGQRQRLLIARQLVRRPRLLFLDEATNAIPDAMQEQLFANLRRLGVTCVVVTHRKSALALADQVYILENGRIAS